MHSQGCCTAPEPPDFAAQARDLDELADDPTLQDCCRRDLEVQAKEARWKAELAPHDRSQLRQSLARQVFRRPAQQPAEQSGSEEEDEDLGAPVVVFCGGAWRLQECRFLTCCASPVRCRAAALAAAHRAAAAGGVQEQAAQRGAWCAGNPLREQARGGLSAPFISPMRCSSTAAVSSDPMLPTCAWLQALLQEESGPCIVAHIAYEGDPAGAALDEYLASWARQYLGTRFVRHVVQPGSTLPRHVGLPSGPGEVSNKH